MVNAMTEGSECKEKKKYTLDLNTWICGGGGEGMRPNPLNYLGEGATALLNNYDFSCCLGQCALQDGVSKRDLRDKATPASLAAHLSTVYNPLFVTYLNAHLIYSNAELANQCILVNDNRYTTVEEKIELLTEELAKADIELEVVGNLEEVRKKQGLI